MSAEAIGSGRPSGWDVAKLGDLIRLDAGVSVNSVDESIHPQPHDESVLKTSAAMDGRFDPTEAKKIDPRDLRRARLSPTADSLIVSRMNTIELVGESGYVDRDHTKLFLPDRLWLARRRPGVDVSMRWLSYMMTSSAIRRAMTSAATGTSGSMKNISKPGLLALEIVRPPVHEQRRIASALSDIDQSLDAVQRLIAKKADLREGVRQVLLTAQSRLPGYAGPWERVTFRQMGRFHRGVTYDPDHDLATDDTVGTLRLLRANNLQRATLNTDELQFVLRRRVAEDQVLRSGDVVICSANGSRQLVGKAAVYMLADGYQYTFGAFMSCFRSDPGGIATREFAAQLFQSGEYRRQVAAALAGSSINNLGPAQLETFTFLIPSDRKEQAAVARLLGDIDDDLALTRAHLVKLQNIKLATAQALLSGRTRLP